MRIYWDIETTGMRRSYKTQVIINDITKEREERVVKPDQIIEIAAIAVDDHDNIISTFHSYSKPDKPIPYHITNITGISNSKVKNCDPEPIVVNDFVQWLNRVPDPVLIAHNGDAFDMKFLDVKVKQYAIPFTRPKTIDTLKVARKLAKEKLLVTENNKQPTLCKHFGINYAAHSAIEDAKALMQMHTELMKLETQVNKHKDLGFL